MDHEAHVGLVDTHAEGVRGDHHADLARDPLLLSLRPFGVSQPAVVGCGGDPLLAEQFARAHVDDARSRDVADQAQQLSVLVVGVADAVREVGPCKAAAQDVGLGEFQVAHDVLGHDLRRRGREGQHGNPRQPFAQLGDPQVGGAEVVAPLRDAVGLIDGQQRDVHAHDTQAEGLGGQPFGGDVEELYVAVDAVVEGDVDLAGREPRVDRHGGDVPRPEAVHLVLHQGDERRDDDAQPLAGHRRDLVGERFAAARGHERQRVAPLHGGADDLLLHGAERRESPVAAQGPVYLLAESVHTAKVGIFGRFREFFLHLPELAPFRHADTQGIQSPGDGRRTDRRRARRGAPRGGRPPLRRGRGRCCGP